MKPDPRPFALKAAEAWEGTPPEWVAELAAYADLHGAKAAGKAIGYSNSAVSVVLNRAPTIEKFDLVRIEQSVRGALMGAVVICPVKGEMTRDVCLGWQARPYALTSSARAEMYRACRSGCPHSRIKTGGQDGR
jgi:hypothetical protein